MKPKAPPPDPKVSIAAATLRQVLIDHDMGGVALVVSEKGSELVLNFPSTTVFKIIKGSVQASIPADTPKKVLTSSLTMLMHMRDQLADYAERLNITLERIVAALPRADQPAPGLPPPEGRRIIVPKGGVKVR